MGRETAVDGDAKRKVPFLWNALKPTDQPIGVGLHFQHGRGVGLELWAYRQWHSQQDGFFKTIVGEVASFELARQRPQHFASSDACGKVQLNLRGQTRVAWVAPIGVPLGLMGQL